MIAIPRLINWGRWARVWQKVEPDGQAMSYEGNWRPKGDGEEEIIHRSRLPKPDMDDAWDRARAAVRRMLRLDMAEVL